MKNIITFPTLIGVFFLIAGIATGLILIQSGKTFRLGASPTATPKEVRITNITDSSFTVSWVTDSPTGGFVKYGESESSLNQTALDEIENPSLTHFASVRALNPNTQYFIKINSESQDYDNNGSAWTTTTGAVLGNTEATIIISGKVELQNQAPVSSTLVYAQIIGSSSLSSFTTEDGNWLITLSFARTTDLSSYFPIDVNDSVVEILVQAGGAEVATAKIHPSAAKPAPPIILGQVHDFTNLQAANANDNIPSANLELPSEATESAVSKFNTNEATSSSSTTNVTLESHDEGEVITTTTPQFFGEGPAGSTLTITIESDPITDTVRVDSKGVWQWSPPSLDPGTHKITVKFRDAQGILRTLTRSFIVQAAEGPAFEASQSASLAPSATPTLSPTPTSTPTPTPKTTATASISPTPTNVPLPVSGTLTPTVVLFMMGIGLILFSAIVFVVII